MDRHLWERAVQYHGVDLLELLQNEQGTFPGQQQQGIRVVDAEERTPQQAATVGSGLGLCLASARPSDDRSAIITRHMELSKLPGRSDTSKVRRFSEKIKLFIAKKADMLFKNEDLVYCSNSIKDGNHFAVMPPLEQFMKTLSKENHERTFSIIAVNDVMIGRVLTLKEFGLFVRLLSFCGEKARCFANINVVALLPVAELCDRYSKSVKVEDFSVGDLIRCQVLKVTPDLKVVVSLKAQETTDTDLFLGLIEDSDVPVHYRRCLELDESFESYDTMLNNSTGFDNPYCLGSIIPVLGLQGNAFSSLMRGLQRSTYDKSELAEGLNSVQSAKWSMQIVAKGVLLFKSGEYMPAVAKFDKALQMYPKNIEALVARGALYANRGSLTKAIEDFESALKLNSHHRNATKYLIETLLENAKQLDSKPDTDGAISCYQRVLTLNGNHTEARRCLERIHQDKIKASQINSAKPPPSDKAPKASSERALKRFMMEKSTGALKDFLRHEISHKDKMNEQRKRRNSERRSRSPRKVRKKKSSRRDSSSSSSSSSSPSPRCRKQLLKSRTSSSSSVTSSSSERSSNGRKRRKFKAKNKMQDHKYYSSDDEKRGRSARRSSSRRRSNNSRNGSREQEKRRSSKEECRKRRGSSQKSREKSSSRKHSHDGSPTKKQKHSKDKSKKKSKENSFEWVVKDDGGKDGSKKITRPARKSRSRSSSVEFISEIFLGKLKKEDLDKQEVERRKKQIFEQKLEEERRQRELLENLKKQEALTSNNLNRGLADDDLKQEGISQDIMPGKGITVSEEAFHQGGSITGQQCNIDVLKGHCSGSNCGTHDKEEVTSLLKTTKQDMYKIEKMKIIKEKDRHCSGSNCGTSDEEEVVNLLKGREDAQTINKGNKKIKKKDCSGSNCGTSDEEPSVIDIGKGQENRKSDNIRKIDIKSQDGLPEVDIERITSDKFEVNKPDEINKIVQMKKRLCSGSNCGTCVEEELTLNLKSNDKENKDVKKKKTNENDDYQMSCKPKSKKRRDSARNEKTDCSTSDDEIERDDQKCGSHSKRRIGSSNSKMVDEYCSASTSNITDKKSDLSKKKLDTRNTCPEHTRKSFNRSKSSPSSSSSYSSSSSSKSSSSSSSKSSSSKSSSSTSKQMTSEEDDDDDDDLDAYRIDDPETLRTQVLDMQKISFKGNEVKNITSTHRHQEEESNQLLKEDSPSEYVPKPDCKEISVKPNYKYYQQGVESYDGDRSGAARMEFTEKQDGNREQLKILNKSEYRRGSPQREYTEVRKLQYPGEPGYDREQSKGQKFSLDTRYRGAPYGCGPSPSSDNRYQQHLSDGKWRRPTHHGPSPDNRFEHHGSSSTQSPSHGNRRSSPDNRYQQHGSGSRQSPGNEHHRSSPDNRYQQHGSGSRQSPSYDHLRSSPDNRYQQHGSGSRQSPSNDHHRSSPDNRYQHHGSGSRQSPSNDHRSSPDNQYQHHGSDEVPDGDRQSTRHCYHRASSDNRYQHHGTGTVPYGRHRDHKPNPDNRFHYNAGEVNYGSRQSRHRGSSDSRYQHHDTSTQSSRYGHRGSVLYNRYQRHIVSNSTSKESRSHWTAKDYIDRDKSFCQYYSSFNPNPLGAASEKQEMLKKLYDLDLKSASFAAAASRVGIKKPHRKWWNSA